MPDSLVTLEAIREAASRIRPLARVTPPPRRDRRARRRDAAAPARRSSARTCSAAARSRSAARRTCCCSCRRRFAPAASSPSRRAITASRCRSPRSCSACPAVVVMPTTAPAVKVDGVRTLGAEMIFEGTTTLAAQGAGRGRGGRARADDRPAVRPRVDRRRPGDDRPRNPRAGAAGQRGATCRAAAAACWPACRRPSRASRRTCASSASSRPARRG